jgi:AcrR family transcriptional regulator
MTAEGSLRERKKRELRRLLAEVATGLFAERGFDAVTVADIAAAANVSTKTVFNHFATKEDLVLDGREEIEAELVSAVRERAPDESILAAVRRHTLVVAEQMRALPAERRAAFLKVVQNAPTVHARMRQMSLDYEDQLAHIIAEETSASAEDPTPWVVANMLGMLTRLAFGVPGWPDGRQRSHEEIVAGIEAAFDLVEHGLSRYGVRKKR